MENNTTYAFTSYNTARQMVVAMIADFVSANGLNGREFVEESVSDWSALVAEYNEECRDNHEPHQEEAFAYYVDGEHSRVSADDVLEALYA